MSYKYPFLDVLADAQEATGDLVLVGGWAPTVYFEYLWAGPPPLLKTGDIDFGIHQAMRVKKPLPNVFDGSRYKEKHEEIGKLTPYQLIFGGKMKLDFICDEEDTAFARKQILENKIVLSEFPSYRFLLKDYCTVDCDGIAVNVPQPARYIAHKIWVYFDEPEERAQDITAAYYCLTRSPRSDDIYQEIRAIKDETVVTTMSARLADQKLTKDAPVIIAVESGLRDIGDEESRSVIHRKLKQLVE